MAYIVRRMLRPRMTFGRAPSYMENQSNKSTLQQIESIIYR